MESSPIRIEYVEARRVLLDALTALWGQLDARLELVAVFDEDDRCVPSPPRQGLGGLIADTGADLPA